ncbi:Pentatricopeptide repeat-containing protein [Artemisia annua]|uniref:Pentatricopeptide repeat-containing protein n=1 Tax=Artemisia annua TaxID=35608 RepID=A0A2U1M6R0_ARTAN|nr:Pentatricopeptide repeat-containing protein [Artemisia annua]
MATLYIKNSRFDKAEDCLRKIETLIIGRDRIPYHYLLSHYGSIGKKEEVKTIWESYKTIFPYIPNLGYSVVISSFIRMDDIEEAELLYEEWVSMQTSYDPRIGNLLLGCLLLCILTRVHWLCLGRPNGWVGLQIYQCMNNRPERFRISSSDAAIQLDLVSKVNGISAAEDYFSNIPSNLMDIDLDLYSYNIWISSRGSQGSIEKMEEAFEKLIFDESVNPNWTTHSTMATLYIKNSRFDKAEDCLRKKYRMHDIEKAELLYEEWVSMKTSYDPRIGNLLLGWYFRNGFTEKAETFLKEMLNVGKANSSTWEIVAEGHIKESRISDALSCLEKLKNQSRSYNNILTCSFLELTTMSGTEALKGPDGRCSPKKLCARLSERIYQCMNNRPERFRISSSDAAIQLDLVSKVNGISAAEDYFSNIPSNLMDIDLDLYSYNIWISSRGSQGSIEKMEEAFEKLIFDESVNPNWTTHSTMATLYIKNSRFDKAEDCLRKKYRMHDIEKAELLYEEWVSMKTSYDPRIGNLLLGWYFRNGFTEKAETFLKEMLNVGKANSSTWEIVAEAEEGSSFWRPKPMNISVLYNLCERENDVKSKEALVDVLRKVGVLEDDVYMSFLPFSTGSKAENVKVSVGGDDEEAEDMLLNELQASI